MFGNIDPKKISSMMKQMGIKQEDIEADRVIIEKSNEEGRLIIENPHVQKIVMQGQESFQITGDITEESQEEETDGEKFETDIQTIIEQTGVSKDIVAIELEKNNGNIAETIISLNNQNKGKKK